MDYKDRQNSIYEDGMFFSRLPMVTTDPTKLEEQARQCMTSRSFDFVSGGAGEKSTMVANRLAFRQWKVSTIKVRVRCSTTCWVHVQLTMSAVASEYLFLLLIHLD